MQRGGNIRGALGHGQGNAAVWLRGVDHNDAEGRSQEGELFLDAELERKRRGQNGVFEEHGLREDVVGVAGEKGAGCLALDARMEPHHGLERSRGEGGVKGEAELGRVWLEVGNDRRGSDEEFSEADEGLVLGEDDLRR